MLFNCLLNIRKGKGRVAVARPLTDVCPKHQLFINGFKPMVVKSRFIVMGNMPEAIGQLNVLKFIELGGLESTLHEVNQPIGEIGLVLCRVEFRRRELLSNKYLFHARGQYARPLRTRQAGLTDFRYFAVRCVCFAINALIAALLRTIVEATVSGVTTAPLS